MRMLMQIKMPLEPFNSAVRDGSAGKKMQKIMEAIKPEAAYFTAQDGCRGGVGWWISRTLRIFRGWRSLGS
jgi:hypothetical protein